MNKVRLGFFSFTEITDPSEHHSYNQWHQLDHMPEQFPLDGIAYGQRWVSTPACRAARAVSEPPLDSIHYMTLYLMTDPVERTLREFMQLVGRVIAMDFGEIVAVGPPAEIVRHPRVVEAYIGKTEAPLVVA